MNAIYFIPLKATDIYPTLESYFNLAEWYNNQDKVVVEQNVYTVGERKVDKGYYEDLVETWRKGHSNKKTGQFKTTKNKQRYLDMKAMQDNVKAGLIPFKTDQEILDEIVPSDNRQNMSGMGRKLPGGGSTSRRRANRAFGDVMTRDQITQMFRQQEQEKELLRKQAEEAQARAYLAVCEQLAQDLARENNNESSGEEEEDEQHMGGDDDYSDDDDDDE
ncbi:hypothetical protein Tco_0818178 [Tanacetum coccineum]